MFVDEERRDECEGAAPERRGATAGNGFYFGTDFRFCVDGDGKTLLLAKGEVTQQVVMIGSGK